MKNQIKLHKKITLCILILLSLSISSFAQQKTPDTLIVNTKAGKIIFISDSLQRFNNVATDALIKKSLLEVQDSLSETKQARAKRLYRERFTRIIHNKFPLRILPNIGIGTLRDKISPLLGLSIDFGPQRQDYYLKNYGHYTFINLAANMSFSYTKDALDKYHTDQNLFIEASMGNRVNNFTNNVGMFSEASFGIGYLAHKEGNYFEGNTFKVFFSVGLYKSFVKVKPELYITDNFKKAFPGITLKFF